MGRLSKRDERRAEILTGFAKVLARHGYAGATIIAVATETGVAPGLVHHYFESKDAMLEALLDQLVRGFRRRVADEPDTDRLLAYANGALRLDERADVVAARCWASLFAESLRDPRLLAKMRRLIDTEIGAIEERSGHRLDTHEASAVLAYIIGAIVLGAFAPRKTAGFAAPGLVRLIETFRQK